MKGFTLIELLVVVLIIGILASVALPQYQKAVERSRQSEAWTTMKSINDAVKIYQMEKGSNSVPSRWDDLTISFVDAAGSVVSSGTHFDGKAFQFQIRTDGVTAQRIAANGGTLPYSYTLALQHNGTRMCAGTDCRQIGAKATKVTCRVGLTGDCYDI